MKITYWHCYKSNTRRIDTTILLQYLLGDLDKEDEDDKNEQVVKDADSSDDDVDDLECKVTDVGQIQRQIVGL